MLNSKVDFNTYTTPKGENCVCYMYIAVDTGESDNTSEDTHTTYWISFDKVEETLGSEAKESRNMAIYLHFGYTEFITSFVEDDELVLFYGKTI